MSGKLILAAALGLATVAALVAPADAETPAAYTVAPAGPVDSRNTFVGTTGAVFIVDNAKGQVSMCYPDSKDGKITVSCTAATKLPQ